PCRRAYLRRGAGKPPEQTRCGISYLTPWCVPNFFLVCATADRRGNDAATGVLHHAGGWVSSGGANTNDAGRQTIVGRGGGRLCRVAGPDRRKGSGGRGSKRARILLT